MRAIVSRASEISARQRVLGINEVRRQTQPSTPHPTASPSETSSASGEAPLGTSDSAGSVCSCAGEVTRHASSRAQTRKIAGIAIPPAPHRCSEIASHAAHSGATRNPDESKVNQPPTNGQAMRNTHIRSSASAPNAICCTVTSTGPASADRRPSDHRSCGSGRSAACGLDSAMTARHPVRTPQMSSAINPAHATTPAFAHTSSNRLCGSTISSLAPGSL